MNDPDELGGVQMTIDHTKVIMNTVKAFVK